MTVTPFFIIVWTLIGLVNLVCSGPVSKVQYAMIWLMLMCTMITMYFGA